MTAVIALIREERLRRELLAHSNRFDLSGSLLEPSTFIAALGISHQKHSAPHIYYKWMLMKFPFFWKIFTSKFSFRLNARLSVHCSPCDSQVAAASEVKRRNIFRRKNLPQKVFFSSLDDERVEHEHKLPSIVPRFTLLNFSPRPTLPQPKTRNQNINSSKIILPDDYAYPS